MKKILSYLMLVLLASTSLIVGCKKTDSNPMLESQVVKQYDLVQLTSDKPNFPVIIGFSDNKSIDSVIATIYPMGGDSSMPIAKNMLTNFNNTNISSTTLQLAFPTADIAPNGIYTVRIVMYSGGKMTVKTYNVNVINNIVKKFCTFVSKPLPAGKNTWVRLTSTVTVAPTDNVYITGSFEGANGGSDWSGGGNSLFKMERLSDNCFEIAVNLTSSNEFKFTLGEWGKERFDNLGNTPPNSKGTEIKDGVLDVTAYNWKTYTLVVQQLPEIIPGGAIKNGMMTVIADLGNQNIGSNKYYIVKQGGDVKDVTYQLERIGSTNRLAAAVPQGTDKYYVVRNNGGTQKIDTGVTAIADIVMASWDGMTNPVKINVPFFTGDAGIVTEMYIVGDATPDGWNNNPTNAGQKFSKVSNGVFELTIALDAGKVYKFLSSPGNWQPQFGGTGTFTDAGGQLGANYGGGSDPNTIPTPAVQGNYKINVNLKTMTFTVTKQ